MPRFYAWSEAADLANTKSAKERQQLQRRDPRTGLLAKRGALYLNQLDGRWVVGRDGESEPLGTFSTREAAERFLERQAREEDTSPSQGEQPGARLGREFPTGTAPDQGGRGQSGKAARVAVDLDELTSLIRREVATREAEIRRRVQRALEAVRGQLPEYPRPLRTWGRRPPSHVAEPGGAPLDG